MEPTSAIIRHEAIDPGELLVHDWRVKQLKRLGIPGHLAEGAASHVDWREIARLVRRGCPRCSPSASSADAATDQNSAHDRWVTAAPARTLEIDGGRVRSRTRSSGRQSHGQQS